MSMSWRTETGHMVCRWSEVGKGLEYNPRWIQDAPGTVSAPAPRLNSFTRLSPFGGGRWYLPRRA